VADGLIHKGSASGPFGKRTGPSSAQKALHNVQVALRISGGDRRLNDVAARRAISQEYATRMRGVTSVPRAVGSMVR
jgi:hypothetical protein